MRNNIVFSDDMGDIGMFFRFEDAERYFEPWIVEEDVRFHDASGQVLIPVPDQEAYRIHLQESGRYEKDELKQRLYSFLVQIRPDSTGELPETLEDMLQLFYSYVSFSD